MKAKSVLLWSVFVLNAAWVAGCGGGSGGGVTQPAGDPGGSVAALSPMVDSLGRTLAESDFGGGDGDAAGGDGTAGEGAPIANAPVLLVDSSGKSVSTTTDATGYYRVSLKGFVPPFTVRVTRPDGSFWYAPSVASVKKRGFITINLTGLTDKVAGYVADSANVSGGAAGLTPALLASNGNAVADAKKRLNTGLLAPLTYAGLDPTTFDPVTTPFQANRIDKYDFLLDRLAMGRGTNGATVVIGTLAGVKEQFADGPANQATFRLPSGVAVDAAGNYYVADRDNNAIRKISIAGAVTTLAGTGVFGYVDGPGASARFRFPSDVAVDAAGVVYVADFNNHVIRRISPTGTVTTVAGNGQTGLTNGAAATATFNFPESLVVDGSGTIYVADTGNHVIRKITAAGAVSTFAGTGAAGFTDGTGTAASFSRPTGIALDAAGNVYVTDTMNNAVRKISPAGTVSTLAGATPGTFATGSLHGVAVDSNGNVYVSETNPGTIKRISPAGLVTTFVSSASGLRGPEKLAIDASNALIVADRINYQIKKVTQSGAITTVAGVNPVGLTDGFGTAARFNGPHGIVYDAAGNAFVADERNHVIRKITPAGQVSTIAGSGVAGLQDGAALKAQFNSPSAIAIDKAGNLYVVETVNNAVRKVSAAGTVTTLATGFSVPQGVAVDADGFVYVCDSGNNQVKKVSPAGAVSVLAGSGVYQFVDGAGTAASFRFPWGIAVDAAGNLFVGDAQNNAIRKITPAGNVSTVAGTPGAGGLVNGAANVARFNNPLGVAIDAAGNLFVADDNNSAVRKISAAGVVTTLAGQGTATYFNGLGSAASFVGPTGVAVNSGSGAVVVTDRNDNAVRIILP